MTRNQERLDAWENGTELAQFFLAAVFLFAYSVNILRPDLTSVYRVILIVVIATIWVCFLADYLIRFTLSDKKVDFFRRNLIDLASVFFPVARAFLLLKYVRRLPFLRSQSGSSVRSRVLIYATVFVVLFIYVISLAELQAERGAPGATIVSFGDSVWWACVTLATVGYGDFVPVTVGGRVLAVLLMIGGVAIIGTASATIVSYLSELINNRVPSRASHHDERRDGGAGRTATVNTTDASAVDANVAGRGDLAAAATAGDPPAGPAGPVRRAGWARPQRSANQAGRRPGQRKPAWARRTTRPPQ